MISDMPHDSGAPSRGRSVLIIEDHDDAREALRALLELEGHRVAAAANGPSGLALARADRPDVALIDIGLPGVDGYEVARRLRAETTVPPYLVALTGFGQPEDQQRARDAGFDAHLVKPVNPDKLAELVSGVSVARVTRETPGPGSRE